jgi:RecA/RadA recombinase
MSILEKLKKNSTIKETAILSESKFFTKADMVQTTVPALNIALSGSLDGGLTPSLFVIAGKSKHFKTSFSLVMAKSYLDKYPESVLLFYDSEFGSPQAYFSSFGIDTSRVLHTPIMDVEELKFDIMAQMKNIERNDKVIIIIDSIGNLASKKEVEDAINEKSVADMSRAKQLKSLFRMVTPYLTTKDIPLIAINHTYDTQEMYSKAVVSGGTGIYYSASTIWIIGRQQEKEGTEVVGYNFVINIEKSRFVKEKSKIPITVSWDGGISTWSGLLDIALESGAVIKPSNGWYQKVNLDTGELEEKKYRAKETNTKEFWLPVLKQAKFRSWIEDTYKIACGQMISDDSIVDELEDIDTEI